MAPRSGGRGARRTRAGADDGGAAALTRRAKRSICRCGPARDHQRRNVAARAWRRAVAACGQVADHRGTNARRACGRIADRRGGACPRRGARIASRRRQRAAIEYVRPRARGARGPAARQPPARGRPVTVATVARGAAIAIAALAAIDPSFTRTRTVPVPISMLHDGQSAALAGELRRALAGEFDLIDSPVPSAEATVLIRAREGSLPPVPERGRVFVVDDPSRAAAIGIRSIDPPRYALAGRAAAVTVIVDAHEPLKAPLKIELRAAGRLVASDERAAVQRGRLNVSLSFVPAAPGLVPLDVTVTSADIRAAAGAVVNVVDRKLRVVFSDPQPSWASTFVRRALEQDAAFEVSAHTITSRGVSATAGRQASFEDPAARESIDVVVAGTPSRASAGTLRALEAFARERGGAVVLLADEDAGRPYEQITGARWRTRTFAQPATASGAHANFLLSRAL